MPKIAGFFRIQPGETPTGLLQKMTAALLIDPKFRAAQWQDERRGVACVDNGLLPQAAQIVWNEAQSRAVILSGEIFGYQEWKSKLQEKGYRFVHDKGANRGAEFILHLYEEVGDEFVHHLNGACAVVILDVAKNELRLANGRLGVRPLYYAQINGRLIFGSTVGALLADSALPKHTDPLAIAELLSYEYVLNHRTLIEGVQLLPPATLLTVRNGAITTESYWQLRFAEESTLRDSRTYLEGLIYHLRLAVKRQLPEGLQAGINLSGGIDSRVALGLLNEHRQRHPLQAYTFGIPDCDDVRIARELANTLHVRHTYFELRPEYLIENAEMGVRLTDGMESMVHMHALANVRMQAKEVQLLYTGYILDSIISPDASEDWLAHYSDKDSYDVLFRDIKAMFRKQTLPELFTDTMQQRVNGAFEESFRQAAEGSRHFLLSDWQNRFELLQRQRRFTQFGNELLTSHVICRTPFVDNDLVDFCLQLPPGLRLERALLKEVIALFFHPLAKIPLDKTGYPLVSCGRDISLRAQHHVKWWLINSGLLKKKEIPLRPYADYNLWMRTSLRNWVESILLDARTLDRGYLQPAVIRKFVNEHMAGANYSKELGMMISLELWHRIYID